MDWSGAICWHCGGDRIKAFELYPALEDILYAQCKSCLKGWDVQVTDEGVKLAPVLHPRGASNG